MWLKNPQNNSNFQNESDKDFIISDESKIENCSHEQIDVTEHSVTCRTCPLGWTNHELERRAVPIYPAKAATSSQ